MNVFVTSIRQKPLLFLFWALITWMSSTEHGGIMMAFFALPTMAWQLGAIALRWQRPDRRGFHLTLFFFVLACSFAVATRHYYLYQKTRTDADEIVAAVERFNSSHGRYPSNLKEAGIEISKVRMLGYFNESGRTDLFYAVTYTVFDVYVYDFNEHHWRYQPD